MRASHLTFALLFTAALAGSLADAATPKPTPASTNHWAFQPVTRPALPTVQNKSWPRTPVDFFILAKLEEKGLTPSQPADKATLLRRITFDLHGLPPTPAELDAFLADASPDAFAKVVDRLLASPRYGERWARHWLDLARFSESDGFEYDKMREHAWRYRDYVIRSLNEDKPYARFVAEQIAGDALEPATLEGIAATGFLVAGPYDEAGNSSVSVSLKARIREEEMEDIVAAVGQTFLGVTVNCARCHDHKFDPISQADYYQLKAALDGVRHGNRPFVTPQQTRARNEQVANLKARISELESKLTALETTVRTRVDADVRRRSDGKPGATTNAQFSFSRLSPLKREGERPAAPAPAPIARWTFEGDAKDSIGELHGMLAGGATISSGRLKLDGKGAFVRTAPLARTLREKTIEAWVALADLDQRGGGIISVEAKDGGTFDAIVFGERVPRRWMAGSSFFSRSRDLNAPDESAKAGELIYIAIVYHADNSIAVYRNGVAYAELYTPAGENSTLRTYAEGESHVLFGLRHTGAGNGFFAGDIEEARLYDRALTPTEIATTASILGKAVVTDEQLAKAFTAEEREQRNQLRSQLGKLRGELKSTPSNALVYAAVSLEPGPTYVLARGDVDKRGTQVSAGGLAAVRSPAPEFGLALDAPEARRRARLAEWVTDPGNPLTWRVIVNRVWQHHFGRGLAGSPNDFGAMGERPSHPELLDWLAAECVAQGGSLKKLHRLVVLSAVYQQDALPASGTKTGKREDGGADSSSRLPVFPSSTPLASDAGALDGDNHLLRHYPLRRLEAEAVRDAMLYVSGELNLEAGGPSFRPFKITVSNSHFYELVDSTGPEFNRRSIYRAGIQSGKDPLLDSLDCPDPSTKTPARGVTTTPLQALSLMNNAFVQRQARHFAGRLKAGAGEDALAQTRLAWRLAFGREPRREETKEATTLVREHGLESLCWALLNSSEFLYVR